MGYTTEFDGSRADTMMKFFEALVVDDMIGNNWDSQFYIKFDGLYAGYRDDSWFEAKRVEYES